MIQLRCGRIVQRDMMLILVMTTMTTGSMAMCMSKDKINDGIHK